MIKGCQRGSQCHFLRSLLILFQVSIRKFYLRQLLHADGAFVEQLPQADPEIDRNPCPPRINVSAGPIFLETLLLLHEMHFGIVLSN